MRILLVGHAPWRKTGYGTPMVPVGDCMRTMGHEVFLFAVDEGSGTKMNYNGFDVFTSGDEKWGRDIIKFICKDNGIDVIISIIDSWVLGENGYGRPLSGVPWISWCAIDADPPCAGLIEPFKYASQIWTWSRFGEKALEPNYGERVKYIPLPIDTSTFKYDAESHNNRFALWNIPESEGVQIVGIHADNKFESDRKAISEMLQGFAKFLEVVGKDKAHLLLNSDPYGPVDIVTICQELEIGQNVHITPKSIAGYLMPDNEGLSKWYSSIDVLLHTSAAEGYGLCILQAMSCGVPVIATDNTAMTELINKRNGHLVPAETKTRSPYATWWDRPTPKGIAKGLLTWFNGTKKYKPRDTVKGKYDMVTVYSKLKQALQEAENAI